MTDAPHAPTDEPHPPRDDAASRRLSTAWPMKEDTMTTHDFRPAGAAPRPRAGPRAGRTSASTNPRVAVRAVLVAASVGTLLGLGPAPASAQPELRSTIALTSTRDNPTIGLLGLLGAEIYLINPDPDPLKQNLRRLTDNAAGDAFPVMSPDGKKIVFESNRNRTAGEPLNTGDLFLMEFDGTAQRLVTRGSTASWRPDSKRIVFHASASGTGRPVHGGAGPPTCDSDLFDANVDDLLDRRAGRANLTNTPQAIEADANWSPDGKRIAFVRRPKHEEKDDCAIPLPNNPLPMNPTNAEIYVINADGTGEPTQLTNNGTGTAGPAWSPDGKRIAFMCRPDAVEPLKPMDLCVMNADGSNRTPLTNANTAMFEGTPNWSPDGGKMLFTRGLGPGVGQQLLVMDIVFNPDGTVTTGAATQLTAPPGINTLSSWGLVRVTAP